MTFGRRPLMSLKALLVSFGRNQVASSAVEFSIVASPFVFTLLAIVQMSLYYMTQSALDSGVVEEADALVSSYYSAATPTAPSVTTLKTLIASKSGGLVQPTSTMLVDLQPFSNLTLLPQPIGTNATPNIGSPGTVLALRAQAPVTSFMPFLSSTLVVRSAVLVRRQSQ